MEKREKLAWGLCAVLAVCLAVCIVRFGRDAGQKTASATASPEETAVKAGLYSPNINYEYLVGSTAWQFSAESHALMLQAFNEAMARVTLYKSYCDDPANTDYTYTTDEAGRKHMTYKGKKLAVVSDIDDTLVDGADYTANIIGSNGDYNNAAFARFVQSDQLTALPGAVAFANACVDAGIDLFYVTNRSDQGYKIGQADSMGSYDAVKAAKGEGTYKAKDGTLVGATLYQVYGKSAYDITIESMTRLGFPISRENLIVNDPKATGLTKEPAREAIRQGADQFANGQREDGCSTVQETTMAIEPHEIIFMLGDNISDFTDDFSAQDLDAVSRTDLTERYADQMGTAWIILPNAVYGSSMDYAYKYGLTRLFEHYDYTVAD